MHEHLKKVLQGKPWRARDRRLHTLVLDEVEAHSSLDLFALCGHFSHVVCMGDADQRIPEYMVPAKHMPSSDIMCEEVELRKVACGALEWLRAAPQTTVQVIKFQKAAWESLQEATSVTFHVAHICASSAAMLFRHCRPPFFLQANWGYP